MKSKLILLMILTTNIFIYSRAEAGDMQWCMRQNGSFFNSWSDEKTCDEYGNGIVRITNAETCLSTAYPRENHPGGVNELGASAPSQCKDLMVANSTQNNETPEETVVNTDNVTNDNDNVGCELMSPGERLADFRCTPDPVTVNTETVTVTNPTPTPTPNPTQDPNQQEEVVGNPIIATTNIRKIDCNYKVVDQRATPEASIKVEFDFPEVSENPKIMSQATTRRRSNSTSEYDNFDEYEDDDAGQRNFIKGPLLKFCEGQGDKSWSEFSEKLGDSGPRELWDPSWNKHYRTYLLGLDDSNSSPVYLDGLAGGSNGFSADEKAFINACKKSPTVFKDILSGTGKAAENTALIALKPKLEKAIKNGVIEIANHRKRLEKCEAMVHLTKLSDYDKEYKGGNRTSLTTKASFDQQLKCETYGPEAQDFKTCSDFINTYDASMVAKTALQAGQGIHYQSERIEDQNSLSQQGAIGGIDHRGALNVQKGEIKDRAGYATQNAALDSAKLAALFGILQSMPNRKKLIESCTTDVQGEDSAIKVRMAETHKIYLNKFLSAFGLSLETDKELVGQAFTSAGSNSTQSSDPSGGINDILPSDKTFISVGPSGANSICELAGKNRGASTLIMNDEFRNTAKRILAQVATEAAASFLAAGMLNKQARQIDELLKRIEGYDPSENFVPPSDALLAGPCAFDPNTPGCSGGVQPVARNVGFGNNSLSIGGGGFGGNGIALDADTGFDDAATGGAGTSDRSGTGTTLGSLVPQNNKSGGLESGGPGAAGVKSSSRGAVGGGGGSGASAVGSTGRGGGGAGGAGGSKGGQANGGKNLAYAGSSIGRLSGGRGVGRKPASKDGGANPFANMFKKGGPQNDTLNFRNPAGIGSKSGSIFDRISDRYKVVQSKNLLLEYEEKK